MDVSMEGFNVTSVSKKTECYKSIDRNIGWTYENT